MTEADRVFAKCAWRLIPFMVLLYVVSFIDRSNVGYAALTMNKDLGFSPSVFGFGVGIFFIGYLLFLVPANLILVRVGAKRWIFSIMAVWGAISAAGAFMQGPLSFYLLRFLLGVAEAGFFPGMLLYLTYWFPRSHRARFTASFMVAVPLSFVIGGPISGLILGMDGVAGIRGWQWLFLIEGAPAFVLAFVVLRLLPDGPAKASWLRGAEKDAIAARLAADGSDKHCDVSPALKDPRVYAIGVAYFGLLASAYGVELWLPQIVQAMGFSNSATGFVVALPFAASMAAMILWGRASDRRGERIWHVALPLLLAAAALLVASSDLFVLVALALALVGIFAAYGPIFSLPSMFLSGPAAAAGIGVANVIGNVGSFLGPFIIGVLRETTGNYGASMAALAICLVMSAAAVVFGVGRAMALREGMLQAKAGGEA
jgi:ACS family tartrate transporter-like MFS transporter